MSWGVRAKRYPVLAAVVLVVSYAAHERPSDAVADAVADAATAEPTLDQSARQIFKLRPEFPNCGHFQLGDGVCESHVLTAVGEQPLKIDPKAKIDPKTLSLPAAHVGAVALLSAASQAARQGPSGSPPLAASGEALEVPAPQVTRLMASEPAVPELIAVGDTTTQTPVTACSSLGPINDEKKADEIFRAITRQGLETAVHESTARKVKGYILLTPAKLSATQLAALSEQMHARGVRDFALLSHGPYRNRISLGVYNSRKFAHKRQTELEALGVPVVLQTRESVSRVWSIDVATPRNGAEEIRDVIETIAPQVAITASQCSILTAQT